jgi:hypothetical protein
MSRDELISLAIIVVSCVVGGFIGAALAVWMFR